MGQQRYLTKSRFKLGMECPTKLYYTGKKDYLDRSDDNAFLLSLAEGGYQVGELACLMYPGGTRVSTLSHAEALAETAALLAQDEVTIYEAALAHGDLFVRVDILRKQGADIEIIEVKAKSYRASEDGDFRNAKGELKSGFLAYLQDIAFQRYVAAKSLPEARIRSFLLLADKDQRSSVDGLNQRFKVRRDGKRISIAVAEGTDAASLGNPLLIKVPVDSQVDQILSGPVSLYPGQPMPFVDAVAQLSTAYGKDERLPPHPTAACAKCQFKANQWPEAGQPKSGFHECWSSAYSLAAEDFANGTVLDLWNCRRKDKMMESGVLKLSQVTEDDLGFDGEAPGPDGLTRVHRQWYLCRADWPGGGPFYFDRAGMREAMASWTYPLHFIDFETSTVAIPFVRGRRPYEVTAFQFSHHVMTDDGRIRHQTQWLEATPGVDPNYPFVRALKDALSGDQGTIFRWATHENTVLTRIRQQLLDDENPPADREALIAFIDEITVVREGKDRREGKRAMVDLCDLSEKLYFHPLTKGSTSLKKVLPALMKSSDLLREQYGQARYGGAGISLNLQEPIAWWQLRDGEVADPYALLPPVFNDLNRSDVEDLDDSLSDELKEGGAAMAAYARLQFEDLPPAVRESIESALLRYCELDTLAMVMAVQAWSAWADAASA